MHLCKRVAPVYQKYRRAEAGATGLFHQTHIYDKFSKITTRTCARFYLRVLIIDAQTGACQHERRSLGRWPGLSSAGRIDNRYNFFCKHYFVAGKYH